MMRMTRREFFSVGAGATAGFHSAAQDPVIVPLHLVLDGLATWRPGQTDLFWRHLWPQTNVELGRCGIRLQSSFSIGGIWRPPGREPMLTGLVHGALNLVITNRIPMGWDRGRLLNGIATRYRGYHVCMIALDFAHGLQIPLLSVNTCTHELLHALMLDIFENRPPGLAGQLREFRIDWYATRLWMLHDGAAIRTAARQYVTRLAQSGE
jgi:hypothetical protein